jgi:hypothetical protein
MAWGTNSLKQVRYITSEGDIEIKEDEVWDSKLPLWDIEKEVTHARPRITAKL